MTKSINALIIDDDTATRFLTRRVLEKYKSPYTFIINEAVNGLEGLEYISTLSYIPEVILLDLQMPIIDGFQFLNIYEQLLFPVGRRPSVFILSTVISNFSTADERNKNIVNGLFEKPLMEHHIKEIISVLDFNVGIQ